MFGSNIRIKLVNKPKKKDGPHPIMDKYPQIACEARSKIPCCSIVKDITESQSLSKESLHNCYISWTDETQEKIDTHEFLDFKDFRNNCVNPLLTTIDLSSIEQTQQILSRIDACQRLVITRKKRFPPKKWYMDLKYGVAANYLNDMYQTIESTKGKMCSKDKSDTIRRCARLLQEIPVGDENIGTFEKWGLYDQLTFERKYSLTWSRNYPKLEITYVRRNTSDDTNSQKINMSISDISEIVRIRKVKENETDKKKEGVESSSIFPYSKKNAKINDIIRGQVASKLILPEKDAILIEYTSTDEEKSKAIEGEKIQEQRVPEKMKDSLKQENSLCLTRELSN